MTKARYNILVVYAYHRFPLRPAIRNHLYCFRESTLCRTTYINLRYRHIGPMLRRQLFDLIVFDTNFAGQRWQRRQFARIADKALVLKDYPAPKAIIPQDDFLNTDLLDQFINTMRIDHVFTALPESEWSAIYARSRPGTRFHRVLTGYLSPKSLRRITRLSREVPLRKIDIGYRTDWKYWFGRHGLLRQQLADAVTPIARSMELKTDIDTGQKSEGDRLRGDDWFRYLLACKYALGTDGGTSILDRYGRFKEKTEAYLLGNPEATFDEVEKNCFPGEDGKHQLVALSPRHLEACATRTCQILVEGTYNGILHPGVHYIEIKRDFSNLKTVLAHVRRDDLREEIVTHAYRDIVESGEYSYNVFVRKVLDVCLKKRSARPVSLFHRWLFRPWMGLLDRLTWGVVFFVDKLLKPQH